MPEQSNTGRVDNEELQRFIDEHNYLSPLEVLVAIANGDIHRLPNLNSRERLLGISLRLRADAAEASLAFTHKKLPIYIESSGNNELAMAIMKAQERRALLEKKDIKVIDAATDRKPDKS